MEEIAGHIPEIHARNLEEGIFLEQLLSKAQRIGILSASECELVRKFHCEGFLPEELRQSGDGPSAIALYYRIQRAVHRLRRIGAASQGAITIHKGNSSQSKKVLPEALDFSEEMGIRNSEKGCSPEPTPSGTQRKPKVPPIAA